MYSPPAERARPQRYQAGTSAVPRASSCVTTQSTQSVYYQLLCDKHDPSCPPLQPNRPNGKEGVAGSSPAEGLGRSRAVVPGLGSVLKAPAPLWRPPRAPRRSCCLTPRATALRAAAGWRATTVTSQWCADDAACRAFRPESLIEFVLPRRVTVAPSRVGALAFWRRSIRSAVVRPWVEPRRSWGRRTTARGGT